MVVSLASAIPSARTLLWVGRYYDHQASLTVLGEFFLVIFQFFLL